MKRLVTYVVHLIGEHQLDSKIEPSNGQRCLNACSLLQQRHKRIHSNIISRLNWIAEPVELACSIYLSSGLAHWSVVATDFVRFLNAVVSTMPQRWKKNNHNISCSRTIEFENQQNFALACNFFYVRTYENLALSRWWLKFDWSKFLALRRRRWLGKRWLRLISDWWIVRGGRDFAARCLRCTARWPNSCGFTTNAHPVERDSRFVCARRGGGKGRECKKSKSINNTGAIVLFIKVNSCKFPTSKWECSLCVLDIAFTRELGRIIHCVILA